MPCEARCDHCKKWFHSPIQLSAASFATAVIDNNPVSCANCGETTDCSKSNMRYVYQLQVDDQKGIVSGHEHDDRDSKEICWQPAPRFIEVLEASGTNLRYRVRRTDIETEMWITDGTANRVYGV